MNKKIVHDALILTAFTLVLGLILGLVHEITKAPIEAANLGRRIQHSGNRSFDFK